MQLQVSGIFLFIRHRHVNILFVSVYFYMATHYERENVFPPLKHQKRTEISKFSFYWELSSIGLRSLAENAV